MGDNYGNTFRVEDDCSRYATISMMLNNRFGHLFYQDELSNYLRVEYRFVGEQCPGGEGWAYRNSGIMVHGQRPETMTLDQISTSIEVQLLSSDSLVERANMNVCTPGTNIVMEVQLILEHCNSSSSGFFEKSG